MRSRVTNLAQPLDIDTARNADDPGLARRLHPLYGQALCRAPSEDLVARGLPFRLASPGGPRWLAVDGAVRIDLADTRATHLVLLAFCDAWRDERDERPEGVPLGWVLPVGESLARATIVVKGGPAVQVTLRRRFEVNEGIIGWGSGAFLAVPHHAEAPADWRGPHPRQAPGRYAAAGHAGPLTVLPGSWGGDQTGVEDHIPSASDELTFWLHAIEIGHDGAPADLRSIEFEPVPGVGRGRLVIIAALTAFTGMASPLRWDPRRTVRVSGAGDLAMDLDLGLLARRRPLPRHDDQPSIAGWGDRPTPGTDDAERPSDDEELVFTAAADATLRIGEASIHVRRIPEPGTAAKVAGFRIEALPPADRRARVEVVDDAGRPAAARVRFTARDGRYLPPLGHRDEINPGLYEDVGADLLVGGASYAYVDGSFEIELPADGAHAEVVRGFDVTPLRRDVIAAPGGQPVRFEFGPRVEAGSGHWVAGDTHVHFLAPSTALLQARAEGVHAVHLLATQWGDHHTSLADFGAATADAAGQHVVWVGSENRQNLLGHVGLVGTRHPILPFASGGPPEGPIGGPVTTLMAEWLEQCRSDGGLAVGAHFPLPMAELAADVAGGLLDAVEFQCFDPALASPPIREWYRYLDAGYRLPIVGGTDKMSAEIPLGQIRTYARLDDDGPLTFGAWAAAIRAGRTFVSSGPILEFRADGREPGDILSLDPGATVEVELTARAAQPIVSAVELVVNGTILATRTAPVPTTELTLREPVRPERTGWLAGRSRSPYEIPSAFASSMAAHTSPIHLRVRGRPRAPVDLAGPLALIEGTRGWLQTLAPIRDAADLERFGRFLDDQERRLREQRTGDGPARRLG